MRLRPLAACVLGPSLLLGCAQGVVTDAGREPGGDARPADGALDAAPDVVASDVVASDAVAPDAPPPTPGHLGIGLFWPPPPAQTNDARYAEIASCHFDVALSGNGLGALADNNAALTAAAHAGITAAVGDGRISGPSVDDATLGAVVASYAGASGLAGYTLKDEPTGAELDGWAHLYTALRAHDSAHGFDYVNLLPTYASDAMLLVPRPAAVEQTMANAGSYVTPTNALGQTFVAAAGQSAIKKIQLNVDAGQWSAGESLTLHLYDGPARGTLLAASTLLASNNGNYPVFDLDATVTPGATYYWELTHDGGGNGTVGWVTRGDHDVYAGGQAYEGGAAQAYDFYFQSYDALAGERRLAQLAGGDGTFVTPSAPLGQTFAVPAGTTLPLHAIELYIDPHTWSSSERLTLTVWDGPARGTSFGSASLAGSNNGYYPRFELDAQLAAGRAYYLELTHDGGGDGSVGWVVHSTGDADPATQGYAAGAAQPWDLVYRALFGLGRYQEYVDTWLARATPSFVSYDHYPFRAGSDSPDYFRNMAIVRDRSLAHGVPFWAFVQSTVWNGMRLPSAGELRWNMFTTLAYGAQGVFYFTYWSPGLANPEHFGNALVNEDGSRGPLFDAAAVLNAEVHALGALLGGARSTGVYAAGPQPPPGVGQLPPDALIAPQGGTNRWLVGTFTAADGRALALVVNLNYGAAQTETFRLRPAPASVREVSHVTGAETPVDGYQQSAGTFALTVAPGDGRLLVLSP